MKKKLLATLLTAAMTISVFSACGQAEDSKPADGSTQVEKSESESKVEESKTEESKVEEPKEIRNVIWPLRGTQPEDHDKVMTEVNKILNENYSLNLELNPITDSEYAQRLELMITSGEYFDMCYVNAGTFGVNVEREAFLPLNDLLENTEIGQKLMEIYPEELLGYGTVEGNIYALPNYQKIYTQYCAFVKKDLADKYGLNPEMECDTLADLEPFMQQVLEGEEDIWALSTSKGTAFDMACGKDYDVLLGNMVVDQSDPDLKVEYILENETAVASRRLINEYFHKGYIREDVATIDDDSADLMAGRYAVALGVHKPGGDVDWAARYGGEYYMIPIGDSALDFNAAVPTMTAISINCEDPEAALEMYYTMWSDPEIFNMCLFGLEGEHYTKVAEDRIEQPENTKYNMGGKYGWQLGNQFLAWKMKGQSDTVWDETLEKNSSAKVSLLSGFTCNTADVEAELAIFNAAKSAYDRSYIYAEDFDAWLNEAIESANESCKDIIIENFQKQIDEWKAANGK